MFIVIARTKMQNLYLKLAKWRMLKLQILKFCTFLGNFLVTKYDRLNVKI